MQNRKKICFVVAVPITANAFLKSHFEVLSKEYDLYLVGHISKKEEIEELNVVAYKSIDIHRSISLLSDIQAVFALASYFRKMKFDAVHSVTPKAGLVTSLAAWLTGIKHRTHIFTGQVWATCHGFKRYLLKTIDRLIASLDNHVLVDGYSQRDYLIKEKVLKESKSQVLAKGSISGVNTELFKPSLEIRNEYRKRYGIEDDVTVFVFMGRFNHDKGIGELLSAFNRLANVADKILLLMFGFDEDGYDKTIDNYPHIIRGKNYIYPGSTSKPYEALQAGDIFCLPTYREGFGSSVIEASCLGLPVICSDTYGVMDAMVDNATGLRCKVGDVDSLYQCMHKLNEDTTLRKNLGDNGRKRVLEVFSSDVVSKAWLDFYHSILE